MHYDWHAGVACCHWCQEPGTPLFSHGHGTTVMVQAAVLACRFSEAMAARFGPASRWTTHSRIQAACCREEAGQKVWPLATTPMSLGLPAVPAEAAAISEVSYQGCAVCVVRPPQ